MRIEAETVEVGDAVPRIVPQQRAQPVDARRIEPLQLREGRDVGVEGFECVALLLPRVDEDRHSVRADRRRNARVDRRRRPAGERQRADEAVAERIMEHRRASARRVKADLLLGLEDRDLGMGREGRRGGEARRSRRR